jgi:hypothetical protein
VASLKAPDAQAVRETSGHSESRTATPREALIGRYRQVRDFTTQLCRGLQPEDCVVQSMPDVSPTKWHLAHTTWFFETFVVKPWVPQYRSEVPQYAYLFNSYYKIGRAHV